LVLSSADLTGPPPPVQIKLTNGNFKSRLDPKWFQ
jgi:hypothetical protein